MKYYKLHLKKTFRVLPVLLTVAAVLLSVLLVIFVKTRDMSREENENRFTIGVVGDTGGSFFQFGFEMIKSVDPSRFTIEPILMDEETAKKKLLTSEIKAYFVIPKGFMRAANYGEIIPIRYYSTPSAVDVSTIIKDEITKIVETVLRESQKGVFGLGYLLDDYGYEDISEEQMDAFNIEYIDLIVSRNDMVKTETAGITSGLGLFEYLAVGISVYLILIMIIPLVCSNAGRDRSFFAVMKSKGVSAFRQVFAENAALFTALIFAVFVLAGLPVAASALFDIAGSGGLKISAAAIVFGVIPVLILASSFAYFMFELFGNIISAVTGYFFITTGMCYISGCIYPLYAMPSALRKIAYFTPTGEARMLISSFLLEESPTVPFLAVMLFSALFFALSVFVRNRCLKRGGA
ncbi:MAG: ABC transporter permease [Clostridia bacterium]|nr:ABC transporter permease [Clostridia bacterium]